VNPDHLFLGTIIDNSRDRDQKGRGADRSGKNNTQAKLTEKDVQAIRLDARPQRTIAKDYGITQSSISLIQSGKGWAHIA
jgi:hypothetical protein